MFLGKNTCKIPATKIHILSTYELSNMKYVNITVSIPFELKKKMEAIKKKKNVNWSEVARRAFEEEIKRLERLIAVEEMDRLRAESKVKWDGVKEVRKWRNSH